jgi:hypothetical protein
MIPGVMVPMKNLKIMLVLAGALMLVALSLRSQNARTPGAYGILETGSRYRNETEVDSGEVWLALIQDKGKTYLKSAIVSVVYTSDPMVDAGKPDQKSTRTISVAIPQNPLFLLKGKGLAEGQIETVFLGKKFIYPGEMCEFKLQNNYFMFRAFGAATSLGPSREPLIRNYTLEYGVPPWKQNQLIKSCKIVDMDNPPAILWAGDLNRDGFLDCIMDLANNYVAESIVLFMSTPNGTSIEKVAGFSTVAD